jgi:hypothetical protein
MPNRLLLATLAVLGLILAGPATAARAADPVLTIVFTGNTYGNVAPCPS